MFLFIVGVFIAFFIIYAYSQSHDKPGKTAVADMKCQYCPWKVYAGTKIVFGNKGWGHVECVEKR